MNDLREKIIRLIENEKNNGRFSILNTTTNIDLIQQIIENYKKNNKIKEYQSGDKIPKKAELIFVAAPTGAGKDSLVSRLCYQNPEKKYIELNIDIFRYYFTEFIKNPEMLTDKNFAENTNQFAYELYYTIQEVLLQEFPGTNIIITGTLKETCWIEETFEKFKNNDKTDYFIKLACLAVPYTESAISVIYRYIGIINTQNERLDYYPGTARYTSLEYHDTTFKEFIKNLGYFQRKFKEEPGKLIDCLEVYRRAKNNYDKFENTMVYTSENPDDTILEDVGLIALEDLELSELGEQSEINDDRYVVKKLRGKTYKIDLEELDESEKEVLLEDFDEDEINALFVAIMLRRKKLYKVKYEDIALLVIRIKENKDYMKCQGTLREVIRDLAVILEYPEIVKRIEALPLKSNSSIPTNPTSTTANSNVDILDSDIEYH